MKPVISRKKHIIKTNCNSCKFFTKRKWPRCMLPYNTRRKRFCEISHLTYRKAVVLDVTLDDIIGYWEGDVDLEHGQVFTEIELDTDVLDDAIELQSKKCPECGVTAWSDDTMCYCTYCGYKLDEECE